MRRREIHTESKTGHERWLVSYADFITLLFGFFVVMYSVSQVSEQKYRTLSETLAGVFEGQVPMASTRDAVSAESSPPVLDTLFGGQSDGGYLNGEALVGELKGALASVADPQQMTFNANEQWVELNVNANLLFDSASADPSSEARRLFHRVAQVLAPFDSELQVVGHTDSIPIATSEFGSNWELSAARAVSVVRLLSAEGISPHRMSAVGAGEFRPVADNDTDEGRARNRRVVLRVALHQDKPPAGPPMKAGTSTPTEISTHSPSSDTDATSASSSVTPVRLDHGGLLFRHDPQ